MGFHRRLQPRAGSGLSDVVSLQPYALLGLTAFAGINYSVALEALQTIGQENVVWVNVGLTFAY
ncbi:MAG: hypothetical protein JHC52_04300 [Chthoniobacterales bacterium]|jgi:hypothetical protein|nr:hypothetical protein [Chthoniobacterales bacterium]